MTFSLILLLAVVVFPTLLAATVHAVRHDGLGHRPPPADPDDWGSTRLPTYPYARHYR